MPGPVRRLDALGDTSFLLFSSQLWDNNRQGPDDRPLEFAVDFCGLDKTRGYGVSGYLTTCSVGTHALDQGGLEWPIKVLEVVIFGIKPGHGGT